MTFGKAFKAIASELKWDRHHKRVAYLYEQYPEQYDKPFIGCTDDQIEKIKTVQQVEVLPRLYNEFLLEMGVWCGDLFLGLDVTYPFLSSYLKDGLNQTLVTQGQPLLNKSDFVFWSQQSHTYAYFPTSKGDDPPVYVYGELPLNPSQDEPFLEGPILYKQHVSEFLTGFIAERSNKGTQQQFLMKYATPYRK